MDKLTVGSCFSGIGGIELGLEWTGGFETKWQIEMDKYASQVLEKHWPDVKRYSDIRDVVRPEPVDLICGGFPCQDVSLAGKRAGLEGKRSTLWGEMHRLICEVKPQWVLAENVPGLLSSDNGRFFGNILRDLAGAGYDAEWGVLSAAGVGAPHLRRRVFIMAHAQSVNGRYRVDIGRGDNDSSEKSGKRRIGRGRSRSNCGINIATKENEVMANTTKWNRDGDDHHKGDGKREKRILGNDSCLQKSGIDWWNSEPSILRVVDGFPSQLDRLKCLGNAVVPQVAQKIGEMILNKETT